MRISDWSSDVCSSDLGAGLDAVALGHAPVDRHVRVEHAVAGVEPRPAADHGRLLAQQVGDVLVVGQQHRGDVAVADEIGRESGREKGGRSVWIAVVDVTLNNKTKTKDVKTHDI